MRRLDYAKHAAMATVLLCLATVGYTSRSPEFGQFFAGTNDFLPRYTQARMVGSHQMYSIEEGYREQDRALGFHFQTAYHDRMPWQALMMAPLGLLPYFWAYWIYICINLAGFAALVCVWLLPRDCVLWGILFFPVAGCLIAGQDTILLTLCAAGALRLAEKRLDLGAGLLLALCTAKPHLFLLLPVALIAHRRWRIVSGALLGTLGLLVMGTAASSLDWPIRILTIMKTVGLDSGYVARRPSLFQFGMNPFTISCALALAVAFGVVIWRTSTLEAGIATAILGSILIAPHIVIYDLVLLLLALPALPLPGWGRWLRITLLTPIPYWALLWGAPWNALLPAVLLIATAASVLAPTARRDSVSVPVVQHLPAVG